MTILKIMEQRAEPIGLSYDSGLTGILYSPCSLGSAENGANSGAGDLALFGSLSRRRARARTRIS